VPVVAFDYDKDNYVKQYIGDQIEAKNVDISYHAFLLIQITFFIANK
jgi:hypothetical protein